MRAFVPTRVNDAALMRDLGARVSRECASVAEVVAHLAGVDARRLYHPAVSRDLRGPRARVATGQKVTIPGDSAAAG